MLNAKLNHDQQSAVRQLASFLASFNKHMIISGAGGTGKSYLMRYINGYWNDVKTMASIFSTNEVGDPVFTGTTNDVRVALQLALLPPLLPLHCQETEPPGEGKTGAAG